METVMSAPGLAVGDWVALRDAAVPALILTKADLAPSAEVEAVLADASSASTCTRSAPSRAGGSRRSPPTPRRRGPWSCSASPAPASRASQTPCSAPTPRRPGRCARATRRAATPRPARHLLPLPRGGALIDSPGVRELGLWGAESGVARGFDDIEALADGCRFQDCRHESEPGGARARGGGVRGARPGPPREPAGPAAGAGRRRPAPRRAGPPRSRAARGAGGAAGPEGQGAPAVSGPGSYEPEGSSCSTSWRRSSICCSASERIRSISSWASSPDSSARSMASSSSRWASSMA
jgi:hypothetical protein